LYLRLQLPWPVQLFVADWQEESEGKQEGRMPRRGALLLLLAKAWTGFEMLALELWWREGRSTVRGSSGEARRDLAAGEGRV